MRTRLVQAVLLVLVLAMRPALTHGATYYVAKTGNDTNVCSSAQSQTTPKLTINAGIGCLSAGDTLIVKAGVYDEIMEDAIPSGSAGAPTVVKSEVVRGAEFHPFQANHTKRDGVGFIGFGFNDNHRHHVTFDGFVLNAIDYGPRVYVVYIKSGDPASDVHDIVLTNLEIKNTQECSDNPPGSCGTASDGFVQGAYSHNWTFSNNKIHDIGIGVNNVDGSSFYSYGMYFAGQNNVVDSNEIYNVQHGYGIHMFNAVGNGSNGNVIRNNSIHDNGGAGILFASAGDSNKLYNNIITKNGFRPGGNTGDAGITLGNAGQATTNSGIYNNTIYGNHGTCLAQGSGTATGNTVRNIICYGNGNDSINSSALTNTIDHNLLGSNPLFVNARVPAVVRWFLAWCGPRPC